MTKRIAAAALAALMLTGGMAVVAAPAQAVVFWHDKK